jgi:hypothetical protein
MRPMGPILLRGRLTVAVLSGGYHRCKGLVPAASVAVTVALFSACFRLHSAIHCAQRYAPRAPDAVARPCSLS